MLEEHLAKKSHNIQNADVNTHSESSLCAVRGYVDSSQQEGPLVRILDALRVFLHAAFTVSAWAFLPLSKNMCSGEMEAGREEVRNEFSTVDNHLRGGDGSLTDCASESVQRESNITLFAYCIPFISGNPRVSVPFLYISNTSQRGL